MVSGEADKLADVEGYLWAVEAFLCELPFKVLGIGPIVFHGDGGVGRFRVPTR